MSSSDGDSSGGAPLPRLITFTPPGFRAERTYLVTARTMALAYAEFLRTDLDFRDDCREIRRSRVRTSCWIAALVAFVAMAASTGLFIGDEIAWAVVVVPAGLVLAIGWGLASRTDEIIQKRAVSEAGARASRRAWLSERPTVVGLCDDGVWFTNRVVGKLYSWSIIDRCEVGVHGVYVSAMRLECEVIPAEAFPDQKAAEDFVARIRAQQAARNATPDQRVARVLASAHVACYWCGYDLHGASQAACPECGEAFDVEDIERHRRAQAP